MEDCEVSPLVGNMIKKLIAAQKEKLPKNILAQEVSEEFDMIMDNIGMLNVCSKDSRKGKGGKKRKPNKRGVWLSKCMRGEEKDGLGRDMKSCSDEYKEKGYDTLNEEYELEKPIDLPQDPVEKEDEE